MCSSFLQDKEKVRHRSEAKTKKRQTKSRPGAGGLRTVLFVDGFVSKHCQDKER